MARTLTAGMTTAVQASTGETIRLLELQFGGGTLRYATGALDVSWNAQTWTAIGGQFRFSATPETGDVAQASTEITLAAVSGSIASTIAGESFIGRTAVLRLVHFDLTTRAVVADPLTLASGIMSGGWTLEERRDGESGTLTATVRCVSRLSALHEHRGIKANRVSLGAHYPDDSFFDHTQHQVTQLVTWGKSYVRLG